MPPSFADDEDSTNDPEGCTQIGELKENDENINVFLRLRPTTENCRLYDFNTETNKVIVQHETQAKKIEKHFTFTSVLNETVGQIQTYNEIVRNTVSNCFDIRGATFASYGVSSSGKTHTILGSDSAGLVPRAITQIFTEYSPVIADIPCVKVLNDEIKVLNDVNVMHELNVFSENIAEKTKVPKGKPIKIISHQKIQEEHQFEIKNDVSDKIDRLYVWISFVEIHNENLNDLLSDQTKSSRTLKIISNHGFPYISTLTWIFAPNVESALRILQHGLCRARYAATGINENSSRSHTIFTIQMIAANNMEYQISSLKFCDLAGAERSKKTGNIGERLKEAGGINTSLLVLGRCLETIQQNQVKINKKAPDQIVPVRDSKLTLLLQSSLLGREKFVMIVNLYPTLDFFDENLNVLKFGSIAKQIVVRKTEARTFKRQSFSYALQHQLNGSVIHNGSFMNNTSKINRT